MGEGERKIRHTLFRPTKPLFTPAKFVADANQKLAQSSPLPWWKDYDAGKVVVIPTKFFLAKEANDLLLFALRVGMDEKVVEEGGDIVEDGFGLEKELGEEREVLGVQLHIF